MKMIKKIASVFLAVLMIFSSLGMAFTASAAACSCEDIPVIYVRGRASLYTDKDNPKKEIPNFDKDLILQTAKDELLTEFIAGLATGDYSAWEESFVELFKEMFKDWALDENCNLTNNSGISWKWKESAIKKAHSENIAADDEVAASNYIYRYFYQYDCRLSPLEIADGLHDYIEAVKRVTGHDKIKIISRCLGTSILTAYFYKYGWADVENVVVYNAIMNGTIVTDAFFTGELNLSDQQIDYILTQQLDSEDELMGFLQVFVSLLNEVKMLGLTTEQLNKLINEIAPSAVPKTLMVSFGTSPGYWAMVSPDKYEQARDFVFADPALREQYKELIRQTDDYYYNVQSKMTEIYKQMEKDGVHVSFITKYGYQSLPLNEECTEQGDLYITVDQQALGTYCAPIGEKLSDEYIAQAEAAGNGKYISPDKIIDASTAPFPNTTWYIKDLIHDDFPLSVDLLIFTILCRYDNSMTVDTDPNFTQFLVFEGTEEESTLTPMTEDNLGSDLTKPEKIGVFINFLTKLIELLIKLFNGEINFDFNIEI